MEFCVSLDHYIQAQPQIDWSAGLGTDSFEAGQPDGVEMQFLALMAVQTAAQGKSLYCAIHLKYEHVHIYHCVALINASK